MRDEDPDAFGPNDGEMVAIANKLASLRPASFVSALTYGEKLCLFEVLIDVIHETNEFRVFLNKRVEDKTAFNKEKMDIYQQIRELETRQAEFLKKRAED